MKREKRGERKKREGGKGEGKREEKEGRGERERKRKKKGRGRKGEKKGKGERGGRKNTEEKGNKMEENGRGAKKRQEIDLLLEIGMHAYHKPRPISNAARKNKKIEIWPADDSGDLLQ